MLIHYRPMDKMQKIRLIEIPKKKSKHENSLPLSKLKEHYLKKIQAETLKTRNRRKILTKSSSSSRTNSLGAYRTLERTWTFSRCINCISPRKTNDLSFEALILMGYRLSMSFSTKSSSNGLLEIKLSNVLVDNVTYLIF